MFGNIAPFKDLELRPGNDETGVRLAQRNQRAATGVAKQRFCICEESAKPAQKKARATYLVARASMFMGWLMGLEPTTTGITIPDFLLFVNIDFRCYNQYKSTTYTIFSWI